MENQGEQIIYQFCKQERIIFSNKLEQGYVKHFNVDNQLIGTSPSILLDDKMIQSYCKFYNYVEEHQLKDILKNPGYLKYYKKAAHCVELKVNLKSSFRTKKETIELSFPQEELYNKYCSRFTLEQQTIYEFAYGLHGREKTLLCDMKVKGPRGFYNPKSLDRIINEMTRVLKRYQEWEILKKELEVYRDVLTEQEKRCMILSYGLYCAENLKDDEIRAYLENEELDIKKEKTKAFQKMKFTFNRKRK